MLVVQRRVAHLSQLWYMEHIAAEGVYKSREAGERHEAGRIGPRSKKRRGLREKSPGQISAFREIPHGPNRPR
jgi:hypothetical protein